MKTLLTKHHQETYDAIFRHPIAHNLHRGDVTAMLGELAVVTQEPNGNTKATRNGHTLVMHASRDKNVAATDELTMIRNFLERSEVVEVSATPSPEDLGHILVVLDHREARIYLTELHGAVPQRITPFDPHGYERNLHYVQDESNGQRKPERKSFYEAIVKALQNAKQILIIGGSTGASSAMEMLLAELRQNHPGVYGRVIGSIALDVPHLSEAQLLAKAREFYAKPRLASSAS